DLLRSDVFAAGSLEDLLFSVGNSQESPVELADVPGVKPSFGVNGLGCQLRPMVVAHHHVRPAVKNFAVFSNFHDSAGYDRSHRADFVAPFRLVVYGNDRRGFSRTVTLKYRHSRSPESTSQTRLQSSRTRNNGSDSASESSPPSRKNKK